MVFFGTLREVLNEKFLYAAKESSMEFEGANDCEGKMILKFRGFNQKIMFMVERWFEELFCEDVVNGYAVSSFTFF